MKTGSFENPFTTIRQPSMAYQLKSAPAMIWRVQHNLFAQRIINVLLNLLANATLHHNHPSPYRSTKLTFLLTERVPIRSRQSGLSTIRHQRLNLYLDPHRLRICFFQKSIFCLVSKISFHFLACIMATPVEIIAQ